MQPKDFEISLPKAVYSGKWIVTNGKFEILEMTTRDENEQDVEVCSINDKETYSRVKYLVLLENIEEINEEIEEYKFETKGRLTDF